MSLFTNNTGSGPRVKPVPTPDVVKETVRQEAQATAVKDSVAMWNAFDEQRFIDDMNYAIAARGLTAE